MCTSGVECHYSDTSVCINFVTNNMSVSQKSTDLMHMTTLT